MQASTLAYYEEVILDYPAAVRKVVGFLGLGMNEDVIARIGEACTLSAMKANPKTNCSWLKTSDGSDTRHLRKVGTGGWRSVFTAEQDDIYNQRIAARLKGTGLEFQFE